jgi:hypothetical protein
MAHLAVCSGYSACTCMQGQRTSVGVSVILELSISWDNLVTTNPDPVEPARIPKGKPGDAQSQESQKQNP